MDLEREFGLKIRTDKLSIRYINGFDICGLVIEGEATSQQSEMHLEAEKRNGRTACVGLGCSVSVLQEQ